MAWLVAGFSAILAGLAMACLAMLLPLKSFEPYVIEVDKTTGFMEIKRPLAEGDLTQSEAITRMNVVRYVKARETYDAASVQDNFDLAQLLSTGDASRDLDSLSSPTNAVNRFDRHTRVLPSIKSIQIPNSRTAIVRFSTQRIGQNAGPEEHWALVQVPSNGDSPAMKDVGPFVLICFSGLFLLAQIVPLTARIASSTQEWAVGSAGTLRGLVTTVAAGHRVARATKSSPRCTTRDSNFI